MDKLGIANEMAQFDRKNRGFYDELTEEERRKFSNYLMIRWGSSVEGTREVQEYYVQSTNYYLNRHFFAINRHPKLQWLCATAVSPALGTHRHPWIAPKKKDGGSGPIKKTLMALYPNMKQSDIDMLARLVDSRELKELVRDHGDTN